MRRSAVALLFVVLAAACGDEGSPAVGGQENTAPPTSSAATSTTAASGTTITPQSVPLSLTGPGGDVAVTVTYDGDQLCLAGTSDVAIDAAHVHAGAAGETGPAVVDFGIRTEAEGAFEGCVTVGAEGGVVLVDPAAYYVDLHTAEHPDGAARAQIG